MKRIILILLLATAVFLASCKAAPEKPIVIGKSNEGWQEYEATPLPDTAREPYAAPERLEYTSTENDLEIKISADVSVPGFSEYPVYVLEPLAFTQEMADRIIPVLLDGAELYEDSEIRTKAVVQERIAYYTQELEFATKDPDSAGLVAPYQEMLANLMKELETAPDGEERALASRELTFKAITSNIGSRLLTDYGKLVKLKNGTSDYEWTEEGRRRAAAAGNVAISGICAQPSGRQMLLLMENNDHYNQIIFAQDWNNGTGRQVVRPDYDEAEAKRRADELLSRMGLACDFWYCERVQWEA